MAVDGLSQIYNRNPDTSGLSYVLRDVDLAQALILPAEGDEGVDLRLTIHAADQKSLGVREWQRFSVYSIVGDTNDWTEHCTGLIRMQVDHPASSLPIQQKTNPPQWSRKTAPRDLWASLHATGICHGPLFQNIKHIESDGQNSWCTLTVANTAATMPHAYESQYIVHPTTLDSAIQAAYTVLPFMGTRVKTAMVPSHISGIKIPSGFASLEPDDSLCAQVKMKNQSPSAFTTDVAVFKEYNMDGERGIELEGLTFQSLGSAIGDFKQALTEHEGTCSSWRWAPDITLANSSWLEGTLSTGSQAQEIEVMLDLRRCTVHFIQEAKEKLTAEDVERLSDHLVKFYRWMQAQLICASNDELGQDSADWLRDSEQERQSLRYKVVAASTNGEMICRLGPRLSAILRRELDPLELMMDGQLLSRYYIEALKWSRSNMQASELVRLCCHKNPRARILEIGGGTGGCTQLVVNALGSTKPVGRYDFTDVSAGFFEAARKRFVEWQDVMDFRKLDIEGDPEMQGFDCGSYDVVLACQVLHATHNMKRTLNNVRKLLKPEGKLILVETTRDQLDLFFTFGLLPGWWLSEEPERQFTPSLTPELWRSLLSDTGFSGVDLEARDCDNDEFYMISTMISTARSESPAATSNEPVQVLLVYAGSPPPMDWLQNLQGALCGKNSYITSLEALQGASDVKGRICVFLGEIDRSLLESIASDDFTRLTSMLLDSQGTLWVTRGAAMASDDPRKALHLGLLRTLRNESHGSRFVSLDLDPSRDPWTPQSYDAIANVLDAAAASHEKEFEYAERDGIIYVPRTFSDSGSNGNQDLTVLEPFQNETRLVQLDIQTPGLLDSLHFKLHPADEAWNSELSDDWVEIEPKAFGLNFRDIMVAMGQLETNRVIGFECAGVVTKLGRAAIAGARGFAIGDRVCALMKGHWASRVRTARTNVVCIPETLSFEQAASIPLAFTTAYISLYAVARLQQGEKVLIHGGAGGVGQAAIILAQLVGAEVFTTAGTQFKRDFLIDKFKLARDHVFSSRDSSFVEGIKVRTNGKGVDVVLNSLAGPLLQHSFDCLGNFGRFVEIGKKDLEKNSRLDMSTFARNVSFSSVDILQWEDVKPAEISGAMTDIMRLLEQKIIDLIRPISVYPLSDIEKAFRTMQSGQHVGKLVVTAAGTEMIPIRLGNMPVALKPDASYLIVGGLGGIGRRICEWMVDHGARHLLILSRSGRTDPFLTSLQERGCVVLLQKCHENGMPLIRGVIQAAMVLKDALVSQMTAEDFHAALRPKVQGSWNLHKVASDVDFFVMLSSLVGVMGGAGQANYAAAGAFQDALAQHRAAQGKPTVTIDLGMVKSIGYVAETDSSVAERLARIGYHPMHEEEVLAVLGRAVSPSSSSASLCSDSTTPATPAVIITGINTGPGPHWIDADWIQDARFVGIKYRDPLKDDRGEALSSSQPADEDSVRARLSRASTVEEATTIVVEAMGRKLVTMFGLSETEVSATQTLAGVGVDSLVAIELRNWIITQLNVDISVFELMEGRTIAEVSEVVVKKYSARGK
ncbi:hypothetical protein APSETT444_007013 [Aspergillus pseudonomiae]